MKQAKDLLIHFTVERVHQFIQNTIV